MRRLTALSLVLAAGFAGPAGGEARASGSPTGVGPFAEDSYDCLEPVPEALHVENVTDDGRRIRLDVLVLLDEITRARAVEVLRATRQGYEPLNVGFKATFRRVRFNNSGEYHEMERAALRAVRGRRPPGFDVVYVMTGKDLHSMGEYSLAGFAFCIGGVRYPRMAFAIGEGRSPWESTMRDEQLSGKIAAHEIGHLLGAHHHYANCAEGHRDNVLERDPSCTLMWPNVTLAPNFGTLESSVIRGHAVEFASP